MKIIIEGTEQEIADVLKKIAGEKVEIYPIYPTYPLYPSTPFPINPYPMNPPYPNPIWITTT